jgi:hypothetical protein
MKWGKCRFGRLKVGATSSRSALDASYSARLAAWAEGNPLSAEPETI